jgi:hypothetical protein
MMVGKAASKDLGINPKEVNDNIRGGITYLKQQLDTHNGDYDKALVAYHDGPNSPYVKGTGPMSPAAQNHIAKVKENGGYEGYQPAVAEEPVDTSVAPVDQINYVEPSASSEESSGTDLLAAGAGAVGGALISPHKPQSKHSIDLQLKERGQEVTAVRERNRAEKAMYDSEVRARDEAIALRKAALDASGKAAGADVKNYTQGQFGGNVPQTINPLDMGEAQSMGKQAVQAQRRVEQMMPGVQFDPTRGLLLPPTIQTLPKVEPQPLDFGIPKVAPLLQHDMPPVKPIYKGSMLGRAGTSVGGAAALGMGANAVDRAMEGDNVGASLGALSALGGAGTQARNPKTAAISGAAGLTALGAQMLYDKFKPKPKSVLEGYDKGGVVKKLVGAAEGPLSRVAEYAHKVFDPRFDERVLEQNKLAALRPRVEQTGPQNTPKVSLADFEGHPFITSMADRTAAGGNLVGVNGNTFNRPVALKGGQDYMFNNPGQVWASAKGPSNSILRTASALRDFTGQDPLYLPWRMAPSGGDFAHMTGQAMLAQAEVGLNKTQKRALDKQLKSIIPDWQGVDHPNSMDQFAAAPSAARKAAQNLLDKNFRGDGGLGLGEARLAVADPKQVAAPEGGLMNVGRVFSDKPLIANSGHESYPFGVPGEGLGQLDKELQVYQMLPEAAKQRGMTDVMNPGGFDIRALQMKPYAGIIDDKLLKSLGY